MDPEYTPLQIRKTRRGAAGKFFDFLYPTLIALVVVGVAGYLGLVPELQHWISGR